LAVLAEFGVEDYLGVDGDYVDTASLSIPVDHFLARDLQAPIDVDRRFDLATSFEVAEHLDARFAGDFVRLLTRLAPVVAFSAAIPSQGGTGHLNEQWPDYWANLFGESGYTLIDCFRCDLWDDQSIECWYRQNLFLYVADDHLPSYGSLIDSSRMPLRVVHPEVFMMALRTMRNPSLRSVLKALPPAMKVTLAARWKRPSSWLESGVASYLRRK